MSLIASWQPAMETRRCQQALFAPKKRAVCSLLMCLVALGFGQLCLVQGWPVPMKDNILTSKIQCFVRERRRPKSIHKDTRQVQVDKDVRVITCKIKTAQTAGELADFLDTVVDKPTFNYIHVAAAYTKMGKLQKKGHIGPMATKMSVLARLQQRLQGMLVRKEMGEQGLSNILWAFANLFLDAPAVLQIVPALVQQIPGKVGDMIPQALSNSLWAAAQLQDAPKVLEIVPPLVVQIESKAGGMKAQHLSNSLWGSRAIAGCGGRGFEDCSSSCGTDPREGTQHCRARSLQQLVGSSQAARCCSRGGKDCASPRGANPPQGSWHDPAASA